MGLSVLPKSATSRVGSRLGVDLPYLQSDLVQSTLRYRNHSTWNTLFSQAGGVKVGHTGYCWLFLRRWDRGLANSDIAR